MSPLAIGALGLGALLTLILAQVPIGFAMMIVGVVGVALQTNWSAALTLLANEPVAVLSNIELATVPLFLLMGTFATMAGFSQEIYAAVAAFFGHRRGGLAYATIGGSAAFGVMCGSSTATAATFTKIALPEMLSRGYSPAFSAGTIAAGGTLKSLIPPSIVMVLYCIATKTFIFDLFLAAIIPALLAIVLNLAAIAVVVRINPAAGKTLEQALWTERWQALRKAAPVLVLIVGVFAGLYSGVFTVNEAASVAAVLSFLCALLRRRITWNSFFTGVREAASATGMLYIILIGAFVFSYFVTIARIPEALAAAIDAFALPPLAIVAIILLAYLVLGAIFDEISAMLITLPFILPIILKLGYDAVWWGVLNVVVIELGMIIPPIGVIVFLLHGLAPQISIRTIYRGVTPFIIADLVLLTVLAAVPAISLWLPAWLSGRGGMVGASKVAKAAPDGYQILLGTVGTQAQNQTLYKAPLYDSTKDFDAVGLAVDVPIILQTKKDFPGDRLPDVIRHIKANASKLSYGSPGAGSSNHLACVLFNAAIGADVTHIPYRQSGELFQDMITGRLDYWCPTTTAAATLGDKVKTIVTFSRGRLEALPNVPTAREAGLKDFEAGTWFGLFLPKGAPAGVRQKLNEALGNALDGPTVVAKLRETGVTAVPRERRSPAYLSEFVASEVKKWEGPIKASGVSM